MPTHLQKSSDSLLESILLGGIFLVAVRLQDAGFAEILSQLLTCYVKSSWVIPWYVQRTSFKYLENIPYHRGELILTVLIKINTTQLNLNMNSYFVIDKW